MNKTSSLAWSEYNNKSVHLLPLPAAAGGCRRKNTYSYDEWLLRFGWLAGLLLEQWANFDVCVIGSRLAHIICATVSARHSDLKRRIKTCSDLDSTGHYT